MSLQQSTMDVPQIKNLEQVLSMYLGHERTVIDHETTRLTALGENYGSQMLALKIKTKNRDEEEILEAVAKVPPPGEFMQRMFNTPVTFRIEIDFYRTIVPELDLFLKEKNLGALDCFPAFFGARFSLKEVEEIDSDAVIILENLKVRDFEMIDRQIGFDYSTAKALVKVLAKFHASTLGLKILKPDVFQSKVRSLFTPYKVFEFGDDLLEKIYEKQRRIVEDRPNVKKYAQRVVDALWATPQVPRNSPELIREPFATIVHSDAWVNNFMVKYQNGVPVDCKLLDFQLLEYGSPVRDLIFFLYTSVQIPVLQQHYDELVQWYHQILIEDLTKFGCNVAPFSFEEFQKELAVASRQVEFYHCMMMLEPLFATQESVKDLADYDDDDMTREKPIPKKHSERAEFIVQEFVKRNWI